VIFTNGSHEYLLAGLRVPFEVRRDRGVSDPEPTEPFLHLMPGLYRAEGGARDLHSLGTAAEIRWRDHSDTQSRGSLLTCFYCGVRIRYVRYGWYHDPDGEGVVLIDGTEASFDHYKPFLACAGTVDDDVHATPVAPLPIPERRDPRETLTAMTRYLEAAEFAGRTDFSAVMEAYLRDRYWELRESGRLFAAENKPHLEQHNRERALAEQHFTYVGWLLVGDVASHGRYSLEDMGRALTVASAIPPAP
jgi:hypothetical protein